MTAELKQFQLCCAHLSGLVKKLYGYKHVHIKNFLYWETSEGLHNHVKVDYIIFKDGTALHATDLYNSHQLKENFIPEGIFRDYQNKISK